MNVLCGYLWKLSSIRCFGPEAKRRNVKDCEGMYQLFNFSEMKGNMKCI